MLANNITNEIVNNISDKFANNIINEIATDIALISANNTNNEIANNFIIILANKMIIEIIRIKANIRRSGLSSRRRQTESQETQFNDFLFLAVEVEKTSLRRLDLMTFWPWLQTSTKPIPRGSI